MIKKLIAPLQKLLLQKKICPACTRPLSKSRLIGKIDDKDIMKCKCGRVFIFDAKKGLYQRALENDLKIMISVKAGNSYLGKK